MTTLQLWLAASLAVVGFAATTLAEARHPPVVLELRQCEQPLEAEVRRIVGVELRAAAIDAVDARDAVTRVVATCRGSEVEPHATVHATFALSAGALLLGVRGEVVGDADVNALGPWAGIVIGVGLAKP